jgi:hypothetical protein
VNEFRLLALGALFLQPLFLPVGEFRKAVAANTELDDMKGHVRGTICVTAKTQSRNCPQHPPHGKLSAIISKERSHMSFKKIILPAIAIAMMASAAGPAMAQNRFMDQAKEAANRRAENKAVREAEHPDAAPAATTASSATPKPAETTPAQTAPAPVEPAAPAAAPAPAPAQ